MLVLLFIGVLSSKANITEENVTMPNGNIVQCKIDEENKEIIIGNSNYKEAAQITYKNYAFEIPDTLKIKEKEYIITKVSDYAFYQTNITEFSANNRLKFIGIESFKDCFNLTSVDLQKTEILQIPKMCFAGCLSLSVVKFPLKLTSIGVQAFTCSNLSEISNLPPTLSDIDDLAFCNCTQLSTVDLLKTQIIKISTQSFLLCSYLQEFTFPQNCRTIGNNAFGNTSLEILELPASIACIQERAFQNANIKQIFMNKSSVTEIREAAFENTPLQNVTFSEDLITIGEFAFAETLLETIMFPRSLSTISDSAFANCSYLSKINLETTLISKIGKDAFRGCINIKSINFPETLENIGESGFYNTGIVSISILQAIKELGQGTFSCCQQLIDADLSSSSITIIPHYLFSNCTSLENIKLPKNIREIGTSSFSLTAITEISLPATVHEVYSFAFAFCSKLQIVQMQETEVKELSMFVFAGCPKLNLVTLPHGLRKLRYYCFKGSSITALAVPFTCDGIENGAFAECAQLSQIDLSQTSIREISPRAFYKSGLKEVILPQFTSMISTEAFASTQITALDMSNTELKRILPGAFKDCRKLRTVIFPVFSISLGNAAFKNCILLKDILFNADVQLGKSTFSGCTELTSADLSLSQMHEIPEAAFANCVNLKHVVIPRSIDVIHETAFANCPRIKEVEYCGVADLPVSDIFPKSAVALVSSEYTGPTFAGLKAQRKKGVCAEGQRKPQRQPPQSHLSLFLLFPMVIALFGAVTCALIRVLYQRSDQGEALLADVNDDQISLGDGGTTESL